MSDRQRLYQLIISQLMHDGYPKIAQTISVETLTPEDSKIPGGQLEYLVQVGQSSLQSNSLCSKQFYETPALPNAKEVKGLEWESENHKGRQAIKSKYITAFIATHKDACICASFSPDGRYAATGSRDASIKLLQVDKIESHYRQPQKDGTSNVGAVIMTFYGNSQTVNEVTFHPHRPFLASASQDCTIRLFEYSKSARKHTLHDNHPFHSIKYHPSGEYILAGTEHPALRLYCLSNQQCYVSKQKEVHNGPINHVAISHDGSMFVSCSKDGSIKFWDGRNMICTRTIEKAHDGQDVDTVQFSKNGKYLLSGGMDGVARLWDVSSGHAMGIYGQSRLAQILCPARFSFDESQVIIPDPKTGENKTPGTNGLVYDTLTFTELETLAGHTSHIRGIAASPVDPYVITCSEDTRARFLIDETSAKP